MKTDSPYYKYASKLMEFARRYQSVATLRLAVKIEATLPDFLDEIDWCGDCDISSKGFCDNCDQRMPDEPRYMI